MRRKAKGDGGRHCSVTRHLLPGNGRTLLHRHPDRRKRGQAELLQTINDNSVTTSRIHGIRLACFVAREVPFWFLGPVVALGMEHWGWR